MWSAAELKAEALKAILRTKILCFDGDFQLLAARHPSRKTRAALHLIACAPCAERHSEENARLLNWSLDGHEIVR